MPSIWKVIGDLDMQRWPEAIESYRRWATFEGTPEDLEEIADAEHIYNLMQEPAVRWVHGEDPGEVYCIPTGLTRPGVTADHNPESE